MVRTGRAAFSLVAVSLLFPLAPTLTAQQDSLYRVVAEPSEVLVAVGQEVALNIRVYDGDGNEVDVDFRLAAPRTGVRIMGDRVIGRQVGDYRIHVQILVPDPDAPERRTPSSIWVENPPPGFPGGPAASLVIPTRVVWPAVERVEITRRADALYVGIRILHAAVGLHGDGTTRDRAVEVGWSSSDESVATVDRHGYVIAHREGTVAIRAEIDGVVDSTAYRVRPLPAERLVVEGGAESARTGDVLDFTARAIGRDGRVVEDLPVEWTYTFLPHDTVQAHGAGAAIADGRFVAQVPGVYTVTASAGPLTARSTVEIHPRDVLHRVHEVGRGRVTHTMSHDFWVWEGLDGRDYAITGTTGGTAYIWDITDPTDIAKTDSIQVDARQVNDVKVSPDGRYGVLTREGASNRRNGVVILDLRNPANPVIAAEHTESLTGGVHNVWPEDDYLYALSGGERIVIIDMSDIYNPRNVGSYNPPNSSIHDVMVHDGIAYSSEWENGIVAVDVGNGDWGGSPENPAVVTRVQYPGMLTHTIFPYRQESTGRFYLFASDEIWPRVGAPLEGFAELLAYDPETGLGGRPAHTGGFVHIIDFTDPDNPEKVAQYRMDEYGTHNPWVENDILYQGYYEGGLRLVDVSGPLKGDLRAQGREMVAFKPYDPTGFIANAPMVWGAMPFKGHVFFNDANSGLWAVRVVKRDPAPILSGRLEPSDP
jgi:hypothetical protein